MSNVSRLIHAVIFSLSVYAWFHVYLYGLGNNLTTGSLFYKIYFSASAASLVIYIASVIFQNVSLYDTYWGLQGTLYAVSYYWSTSGRLDTRSIVALVLTCVWSLRLTLLFALYSWTDIYAEDWRYRWMRNKQNNRFLFSIRSLVLHYFLPMNMGFFGHVPLFFILNSKTSEWGFIDGAGVAVTLFGVVFEAIADSQLRSGVFKAKLNTSAEHSGTDAAKCMTTGLWSLCRHPNYFGEYLYWLGIYIIGLGCGAEIFSGIYIAAFVVGTCLIYLVLNYVSIPLMEKRQLKRREEAYKRYMTSVPYKFFPLNLF